MLLHLKMTYFSAKPNSIALSSDLIYIKKIITNKFIQLKIRTHS